MVKVIQPNTSLPYKCTHPECNKSFSNQGLLTRHMRIHTGEKPFACEICGKQFSQRGNLSKHLLSHENAHLRWNRETNFKPFKCPHPGCGKSFTAKLNLQNHIAAQHPTGSDSNIMPIKVEQHSHGHPTVLGDANTKNESACLHSGCNLTFSSEAELRAHIFNSTPGILAEFNFLREMALKFAIQVSEYDTFSPQEQASMRTFARSALQAMQGIPAAADTAASSNSVRCDLLCDVPVVSESSSHLSESKAITLHLPATNQIQQDQILRDKGTSVRVEGVEGKEEVEEEEEEDGWISDLGSILEDFSVPHYHTTDCIMDGSAAFSCSAHTAAAAAGHLSANNITESKKHCQSMVAVADSAPKREEESVTRLYAPLLYSHDKIATGWEHHHLPPVAYQPQYHTIANDPDGSSRTTGTGSNDHHAVSGNTHPITPPSSAENRSFSAASPPPTCCGGHRKKSFDIDFSVAAGKKQKL